MSEIRASSNKMRFDLEKCRLINLRGKSSKAQLLSQTKIPGKQKCQRRPWGFSRRQIIYMHAGMLEDDKKRWCDLGPYVQSLHSFVHREVIFLLYGSDEIAP